MKIERKLAVAIMTEDAARAIKNVAVACDNEKRLLQAALCALRSYQYGNASPELAQEIADSIRSHLDG